MSETAEELERLAREIEQTAKGRATAAEKFKGADRSLRLLSESNGLYEASRAIRSRAAELRAQRVAPAAHESAPAYKPQPKPEEAAAGQWWMYAADGCEPEEPGRVDVVTAGYAEGRCRDGSRWLAIASTLTTNPNWLYLGSDTLPAT